MPVATATTEPTIEETVGTMPVATATTEPTTKATAGTMPVATPATEPTTEATDDTMPVATAAMETTEKTTEATGIFDICKMISIENKELRILIVIAFPIIFPQMSCQIYPHPNQIGLQ